MVNILYHFANENLYKIITTNMFALFIYCCVV